MSVIRESQFRANPAAPKQLIDPNAKQDPEEEDEGIEEMAAAGAVGAAPGGNMSADIGGFMAPLGASNLDMGRKPAKPGKRVKRRKKTFVRLK